MMKLYAILMVGIIVIGCSDFTSTVDIEATVEAIVETTVEARSKQNTPTSTAIPPTSTAIPPTSTAVPPTSTALPPTATATPPPTPVSASTDRKKDNTPSPTSISTPVASSQLSVNCSFQEEQLKVSCTANRHQPGTQLAWSSNATSRTSGGTVFDFILEKDLREIRVFLESCSNNDCQIETTVLQRKSQVLGAETKNEKNGKVRYTPFMTLPFTTAHEPSGIMPMGETIEHPPPRSPEGHPGIDFQWDHKAPIVAAADGKVVQITSNIHKETGIFNLSVSVVTEEFIVNYTTLESVREGLEVGTNVVVGQVIGYPTPVQKRADWYMIHWDFGTYVKHPPITDPEGLVTEYTTTRRCPIPYFIESEQERVLRIWKTVFYDAKKQFPDLCNGSWKNYEVIEENKNDSPPTSATIPQSEPISKPVLILPFTSEHVPWEILPMGETTLHPPWPGEKPWGHPGIDFIWHHKAPIVAALDGEVLHIITEEDPGIPGVIWYTVQVMTGEFVVNYNVTEFESISPSLKIGSKVVAGQTLGYPNPITAADVDVGIHSMHWEFGTWEKVSDPKPNPSGVIEHYRTTRICPVQYFSDSERERLTTIWEAAQYNEKEKFPDLCNGPYKNY